MRRLDRFIGRQIRRPSGPAGRLLGHVMAREHMALAAWMLEPLEIGPADAVLDVGCGGGMTLKTLAGMVPGGFAAGIDHSSDMVAQASWRNRAGIAAGRVEVVQGDVAAMPFADDRFDLVCGVETLYFWPDPQAGLAEIARVLKPGGRVAMVMDTSRTDGAPAPQAMDRRMDMHIYCPGELEALFAAAGFTAVTVKTEPGRGRGWICAYGTRPGRAGRDAGRDG